VTLAGGELTSGGELGSTTRHESADVVLTADRVETKYMLEQPVLRRLLRELSANVPVHRFQGEGANQLPDPQHFVTSVYFDTATHRHYQAALDDHESNVKLRAREYYDLLPSLAELATDERQIVRDQPWVWLELKQRDHGRSRKLRCRLPKREVAAFFRGERAAEQALTGDVTERAALLDYVRTLGEPLLPSCVVNYRRVALQDDAGRLRITLDLDVGYYPPPGDLWTRTEALVRGTLGPSARTERAALVEIKRIGAAPLWLERALSGVGAHALPFSKFVCAVRAVHG
jgi:hypothetical protein